MEDLLLPEFKQMLLLLIQHGVNFMVIGGYAVIYYGYGRTTKDIDILIEPDNENRNNIITVLREFGIGEESLNELSRLDMTKAAVFYFGEHPRRIDFLTQISGVNFFDAIQKANYFPIGNEKIPVIDFKNLIINKMLSDRLKDKADVEELQKIAKYRAMSNKQ